MASKSSLEKSAGIAMRQCMGLKKGESVLIIFDQGTIDVAESLMAASSRIISKVRSIKIPIPLFNAQEPSRYVAAEMKKCDVLMLATSKSLSHTNARIAANKEGVRIASMPGINKEMMIRCMNVDYYDIAKMSDKVFGLFKPGSKVKITSDKGTNLEFKIMRRIRFNSPGLLHKKGEFGNLPDGEADIGIKEGTANGVLVIDASIAEIGLLKSPIRIEVKDGYAVKISGKSEAKKLSSILNKIGDKGAFNLAELGIGSHPKAKIVGNILEDEKVLGTCHIALGNNTTYGGKCSVQLHIDGIIRKPTLKIDGKLVIDKGKFCL